MRKAWSGLLVIVLVSAFVLLAYACRHDEQATDTSSTAAAAEKPRNPNVTPPDNQFGLQEVTVDKFAGMDNVTLTDKNEIRGRIVWNLWTGDSWKMWDYLAKHGFGTSDLIKTVDSRNRGQRFQRIGTINQPGFMSAPKPLNWVRIAQP